jgi:uncharacterized repeat protein (TIGR01451 family)
MRIKCGDEAVKVCGMNNEKGARSYCRANNRFVLLAPLFLIFTIGMPLVLGLSDTGYSENASYEIRANLPAAIVYNVSVVVTVPQGMIYDAESLESTGASSSQKVAISSPNDGSKEVVVSLEYGEVDNSANRDLRIRFKSLVSNAEAVQNGLTLPPINATMLYKTGNGDQRRFSGEMDRVTVIEPDLEMERSFTPVGGWRGERVNCSLFLRHSPRSTAAAYDVAVTESLPKGLTYLPGSLQIVKGPQGSFQEEEGNLSVRFSQVNLSWSGEKKICLSYQATVDNHVQADDSLQCRAALDWTSTAGENPEERQYTIISEAGPMLTPQPANFKITLDDNPDPVRPGGLLNYTISCRSTGGSALETVVDAGYDPNLAFVSANPSPDPGKGNLWTLGDLDNNSTAIIRVTLRAGSDLLEGSLLTSSANLSSPDGPGAQAFAQTNVSRAALPRPDLAIERSFSPAGGWRGDIVNCNLLVRHSFASKADAYDVVVYESLPQGLIYLPGTMQIVNGPQEGFQDDLEGLSWHFPQMDKSWEGDKKIQLKYQAKIDTKVQANDSLKCLATLNWTDIAGEDPDEQHYTITSEGSIMLTPKPANFRITLADNPDPVRPGGLLNYTISYLNTGGYALGTGVKADYDPSLAFVSAFPSPDTGTDNLWTLGDLDKDGSGIIRAILRTSPTLPDGSMLTSSASISSPDGPTSSASAMTAVSNTAPLLFIEKSATEQLIRPGGRLNYTINYRNGGSSEAGNVTVTDNVDPNLLFNEESASPRPSKIWKDEQGTHLYWNASVLGTQVLAPEGSGRIEFAVSLPPVPEHPTFDWVYNNYKIDSDQSQGQFQILETPVVHSLFVRKKADKAMYMRGDTVNYTITYGNELAFDATQARITDILPDVEYLDANPLPNFNNGSVLIWNIGLLPSKSSGTIQLYVRINKSLTDIKFQSSQSVSGQGYMQLHQLLSTAREPKRLTNYVYINATYLDPSQGNDSDSSSAGIGLLDALGTEISIQGHGSGSYAREEETSLRTNNSSIKVETSLHESYQPSSFTLPGGRKIGYTSKWSEAVVSRNRITDATTNERYMYANRIDRNSSLHLDKNGSTLISETAFEGSGHIGQLKGSSVNNAVFSRKTPAYDSDENYLGSFRVITKFDEYGKSITSSRSVNGTGYVSSDKRIAKSQRSYESGTGNYQAEDEIQTQSSYMAKDLTVSYAPMNYSFTPNFKVDLSQKWTEGMWSRSGKPPLKGTNSSTPAGFIGEEYSMADYLNKSTVASGLNQMKTEAEFTGRAKFQVAYDKVINKSNNRAEIYDEYAGRYKVARNVEISGVARFNVPHLSITKTGQREPSEGSNINYLITVTNDGNQALGPVYVQDLLPLGTEYVYSSARPTQIAPKIVQWALPNLSIGNSIEIELKLRIAEDMDSLVNRVQARGGYSDRWVVAENYSSLQLGWLSCCPPQLLAAKEAFVDPRDKMLVHYRITLKNRENEVMVATITDQLPAGLMFQNSTLTPSDYRSDRVSWNIANLKPGKMRTIDYWARAMYGGTFLNQAHIEAQYLNGTDSAFADVSSTIYVGEKTRSSDNSTWQPPACFGLNCTQQDTAKEWLSCPTCGIVEPLPLNVPCAACGASGQEYGDDIP